MSEGNRATWRDAVAPPAIPRPGALGWLLVLLRGSGIVLVLGLEWFAGRRQPMTEGV